MEFQSARERGGFPIPIPIRKRTRWIFSVTYGTSLKTHFKEKPKTVVFPGAELSKRNVLGLVMKLWDPLGFLLPVTMKYRMDLQAIWEAGFKWDDPLLVETIDV